MAKEKFFKKNAFSLLSFVILLSIYVVAYFFIPDILEGKPMGVERIPKMFGYLMIISIFVERSTEVLLSAWRSKGADECDQKIDSIMESLNKEQDTNEKKELQKNLKEEKKKRSEYRAESRQISIWIGICIGSLISFVGVRVLGELFEYKSLEEAPKKFFIIADILLTGLVLAGGSEAINKITKIYNNFTTTTAKKAQGQS